VTEKKAWLQKLSKLRRQAKARLRITKRDVAAMPIKDVQQLVCELQLYQIELEMQNEALKQAQAARDRYVDLYDYGPTGYLTLDSKGKILKGNIPASRLLGPTRRDLIGQPVTRFIAAKDQAAVLRHLRDLLATGVRQGCDVALARQDMAQTAVRFESVVVPNGEELRKQILTGVWDITERVQQTVVIEKQRKRLEQQHIQQEREQIGLDLHDGVLQSLFAIGLNLETSKATILERPDKFPVIVDQVIADLNSATKELRAFIGGIGLDDQLEPDLPSSLRIIAESMSRLYGRRIQVACNQGAAQGMSTKQQLGCLYIAKEALSNSLRHTRATSISLSLQRLNGNHRLTVGDNGQGFQLQSAAGLGFGLASMDARAHRLGGTLSVRSQSGKGTSVTLNIPLDKGTSQADC
jgi:PAS domain S-box-containing protein